jgi:shikimate kinase
MSESTISNRPSQIFLIGFMASGKSTVGPLLAQRLDRPFIDIDPAIEARTKLTIAELIAREGEDYFRQIETELLRETAQGELAVIAPGGGAITRAENRELMANCGTLVWLDTPFELCWLRIQNDQTIRPLAPDRSSARARYDQRLPIYRLNSLRIVTREDQTPDQIIEEIINKISV